MLVKKFLCPSLTARVIAGGSVRLGLEQGSRVILILSLLSLNGDLGLTLFPLPKSVSAVPSLDLFLRRSLSRPIYLSVSISRRFLSLPIRLSTSFSTVPSLGRSISPAPSPDVSSLSRSVSRPLSLLIYLSPPTYLSGSVSRRFLSPLSHLSAV